VLTDFPVFGWKMTGNGKTSVLHRKNGAFPRRCRGPPPPFRSHQRNLNGGTYHVRQKEQFYDYQNGVENGIELLSETSKRRLEKYTPKKRKTAERILAAIMDNPQITIAQMTADTGITNRTIQRYLSELRSMDVLKREGSDTSGKWVLM
jgi:ATP-dependent DNA helicase RecG